MTALVEKGECVGCGACSAACPAGAIALREDESGFLMPVVQSGKCTSCGLCAKVCPVLSESAGEPSGVMPSFWAVRLKDVEQLRTVSSGGVFWALAQAVIGAGGVVYGAVQKDAEKVEHCRAEAMDEASPMRRSKYLPSEIGICYSQVRSDLQGGRTVLFSGTGCQIAGLRSFLGSDFPGLVTCEVICHGIPSMSAWRSYRSEVEKRKGVAMTGIVFRDKSLGWKRPRYAMTFGDGSVEREELRRNAFHSGYLSGLFYRESCGRCRYAKLPRVADLSLADFWKYKGPLADSGLGVSLVAVNSSRGMRIFDLAAQYLECESVEAEAAISSCRHLTRHPVPNPRRKQFLDMLKAEGYHAAFKRFGPRRSLLARLHKRARALLKAVFPFYGKSADKARLLAMEDAFRLLSRKKVPVFFCNRVGLKKDAGWRYAPSAERRMAEGLSFPRMYEDILSHESDLRELIGPRYSVDYVKELGRIPQIVEIGGQMRHRDFAGHCVNVVSGQRLTVGQPASFSRTLHVYGRCGAFGYAVEDADTLPSRLQRALADAGIVDVRVVNHGLWGGDDKCVDETFLRDAIGFRKGDMVLFYRKHPAFALLKRWERSGLRYFDITEEWHRNEVAKWCFYDRPGHMNAVGYGIAAQIIASRLMGFGFEARKVRKSFRWKARQLNDYLKGKSACGNSELERYVQGIRDRLPRDRGTTGAIVMNCNPFTNGHRYLIERASAEVGHLVIFVVEEDRSFFKFEDRMEMVRLGTADLNNITVVPSGRFIISSFTFPEYFMKDHVRTQSFDVSSDVRMFCERIAPELGISVRFAGEEPFDPVTARYNAGMREWLPKYGMRFREIRRLEVPGGGAVNATEVRRLLQCGDWTRIARYVPQTTLDVLRSKYAQGRAPR